MLWGEKAMTICLCFFMIVGGLSLAGIFILAAMGYLR